MLLIVVLMVVPIVMVIGYSFLDNVIVNENPEFAGLANYAEVLTDPDFLAALKNTAIFITVSIVAHLVLGLAFAMMLNTHAAERAARRRCSGSSTSCRGCSRSR